jgi:transcriptional regulator with XRE-family HTH domain
MRGAMRIHDKADLVSIFGDLQAIYGLTQRQLAEQAGFYQCQICDWLGGKRSMDTTSVIRLANALGYDLALIPREDA